LTQNQQATNVVCWFLALIDNTEFAQKVCKAVTVEYYLAGIFTTNKHYY